MLSTALPNADIDIFKKFESKKKDGEAVPFPAEPKQYRLFKARYVVSYRFKLSFSHTS